MKSDGHSPLQMRALLRVLALNALLALMYIAAAKFGARFALEDGDAVPLWIPTGISLAAVLLWGYGLLPGVALGAFATVVTTPVPVSAALGASVGYTLEAFIGVYLLRQVARIDIRLQRILDVLSLLIWAAVISTIASATIRVASLCAVGEAPWQQFPQMWFMWWLANVMGSLLAAPLILVWSRPPQWSKTQILEFILLMVLTAWISLVAFGGWLPLSAVQPYPLAFTIFPLLVLVAFRFGQHGSTAGNLLAVCIAVWLTAADRGPFASFDWERSLELVWIFMGALSITTLLLGASVAERRRAEEALQEAYQQVQAIIDNVPNIAIQGYDREMRVVFWNRASEELYGFSQQQALSKRLGEFLLSAEDAHNFEQMVLHLLETNVKPPLREWEVKTASGQARFVISSLFPLKVDQHNPIVVCMDVDITERKQLEVELARVQRLDSIGRMAGGIAHDFNNLLSAITTYAEIALTRLPPDHPAAEDVERVLEVSSRAADLTSHLLAIARRQSLQYEEVDLNRLVQQLVPLLSRLVGDRNELRVVTNASRSIVRADPHQIEQVILNLVLNARDAMPNGGVITIETADATNQEALTQNQLQIPEGQYIVLSVSDTGIGIAAEDMEHIFEPFYTTKGEAGTGLGLAVVYGVVKQSGGHITVQSELGQGSTFRIYLPTISEDNTVPL